MQNGKRHKIDKEMSQKQEKEYTAPCIAKHKKKHTFKSQCYMFWLLLRSILSKFRFVDMILFTNMVLVTNFKFCISAMEYIF